MAKKKNHKKIVQASLTAAFTLANLENAHASGTYTWSGASSFDMTIPGNWNPNTGFDPYANDNVIFNGNGSNAPGLPEFGDLIVNQVQFTANTQVSAITNSSNSIEVTGSPGVMANPGVTGTFNVANTFPTHDGLSVIEVFEGPAGDGGGTINYNLNGLGAAILTGGGSTGATTVNVNMTGGNNFFVPSHSSSQNLYDTVTSDSSTDEISIPGGNSLTIRGTGTNTIAALINTSGGDLGLNITGQGGTTILTNSNNSYEGPTTVSNGSTIGGITAEGQLGDFTQPTNTLILDNGTASFGGNTTFNQRVVQVNAGGGTMNTGNFTVQLPQNGAITGTSSSNLNVAGNGTLVLQGNNSAYPGSTTVVSGTLSLPATTSILGGTTNVAGGLLKGIGTVGTLNVTSGSIHPGNSPGIMPAASYNQSGGTFQAEINSGGTTPGVNNNELVVSGNATLSGNAGLQVTSDDGSFVINAPYTILTSAGETGTFASVTTQSAITGQPLGVTPIVIYDGKNIYLDFGAGLIAVGKNSNQRNVATQLTTITNPTTAESTLLTNLTTLSTAGIQAALDDLSGSQYATLLSSAELANQSFLRRLYDPLRDQIIANPCCYDYCCQCNSFEAWIEGVAEHSEFDNTVQAKGFRSNGYAIAGGLQWRFCNSTTIGVAVDYDNQHQHYRSNGGGKTQTVLGAIYGAYHPCDFYVVGDLILGGTEATVNRSFSIGPVLYTTKGKPKIFQGTLYGEVGMDFRTCYALVQPFFGIAGNYYRNKSFTEHGTDPVLLHFKNSSFGTCDSRLGVHLSNEYDCGFSYGLDLVWRCRWTRLINKVQGAFIDYGDHFDIEGSALSRNAFEGNLFLEQNIGNRWTIFTTGSAIVGNRSKTYSILGGVGFKF